MEYVEVSYDWTAFFHRFFPDEDIKWGNDAENMNNLIRATQIIDPFLEEHILYDITFRHHGRATIETTQNNWDVIRPFIEQGGLSSI